MDALKQDIRAEVNVKSDTSCSPLMNLAPYRTRQALRARGINYLDRGLCPWLMSVATQLRRS